MSPLLLKQIIAIIIALQSQIAGLNSLINSLPIEIDPSIALQQTLDEAPAGAVVTLKPGVYTGHFTCSGDKTIRTSGLLPTDGIQARPGDMVAILESPDASPALTIAAGSGCTVTNIETRGEVQVGVGNETSLDQLPRNVTLKHVVIHAPDHKRALNFHGINMVLMDSWIDGPRVNKQDSQVVWINSGVGPYVILNNYLEGGSETLMVGGDRVNIPNVVPADILIKGNTFTRPMAWKDSGTWNIKNLLEFKAGQRVMVDGNLFKNHWVDAQQGYAIVLTPRNSYGDNPWVVVSDITIQNNVLQNVSGGINVSGDDDGHLSQRTTNIVIRNNKILTTKTLFAPGKTGLVRGQGLLFGRFPQNVTVDSNTLLGDGSSAVYTYQGGDATNIAGFSFTNNVFRHGSYGFTSDQWTSSPLMTLAGYFPGAIWDRNIVGGGLAKVYPIGTTVLTIDVFNAAFFDVANGVISPGSVLDGYGAR
jgi:hypothetical protein